MPALVYASSVGAYSPGPKDRRVDESWPTAGIESSFYSRHKAEVERLLDRFERETPSVRVVRLRPALIFKREAASGIRRLFAARSFQARWSAASSSRWCRERSDSASRPCTPSTWVMPTGSPR